MHADPKCRSLRSPVFGRTSEKAWPCRGSHPSGPARLVPLTLAISLLPRESFSSESDSTSLSLGAYAHYPAPSAIATGLLTTRPYRLGWLTPPRFNALALNGSLRSDSARSFALVSPYETPRSATRDATFLYTASTRDDPLRSYSPWVSPHKKHLTPSFNKNFSCLSPIKFVHSCHIFTQAIQSFFDNTQCLEICRREDVSIEREDICFRDSYPFTS